MPLMGRGRSERRVDSALLATSPGSWCERLRRSGPASLHSLLGDAVQPALLHLPERVRGAIRHHCGRVWTRVECHKAIAVTSITVSYALIASSRDSPIALDVDPSDRSQGTVEDDVLHLLDVDPGRADRVKRVGQRPGPDDVAHHDRGRRGRLLGQVDHVGHGPCLFEHPDTPGRFAISVTNSPVPAAGSLANTSRAARSPLALIAATSAGSSTTSPRDVLMKNAPSFMAWKKAAPGSPRVSALRATWTLTMSATVATSSGEAARLMPTRRPCRRSGYGSRPRPACRTPWLWGSFPCRSRPGRSGRACGRTGLWLCRTRPRSKYRPRRSATLSAILRCPR